jgi:hypothetical protein
MSFRPARFTEADVRRARKAAPDCTVEITTDGTIRIVPTQPREMTGRGPNYVIEKGFPEPKPPRETTGFIEGLPPLEYGAVVASRGPKRKRDVRF